MILAATIFPLRNGEWLKIVDKKDHPVYSKHIGGTMKKYVCDVCGYIYDPELGDPDNGIEPGTSFEALPDDWVCPMCGASKEDFSLAD